MFCVTRLALGLALGSLGGCQNEKMIARHPVMNMAQRNIELHGLVPLIVDDTQRATQVQETLVEIWQLARRFNLERNAEMLKLVHATRTSPVEDAGGAGPTRRVNQRARFLWQEYRVLMRRLRELTTCEEYHQLFAADRLDIGEEESCCGLL